MLNNRTVASEFYNVVYFNGKEYSVIALSF